MNELVCPNCGEDREEMIFKEYIEGTGMMEYHCDFCENYFYESEDYE